MVSAFFLLTHLFNIITYHMQYGVSTIYTPPTDVVINITPGPPAPPSECDQLTLSDMTCTFMTSTSTKYNIVMNLTNTIGTQLSDEVSFDCKLM